MSNSRGVLAASDRQFRSFGPMTRVRCRPSGVLADAVWMSSPDAGRVRPSRQIRQRECRVTHAAGRPAVRGITRGMRGGDPAPEAAHLISSHLISSRHRRRGAPPDATDDGASAHTQTAVQRLARRRGTTPSFSTTKRFLTRVRYTLASVDKPIARNRGEPAMCPYDTMVHGASAAVPAANRTQALLPRRSCSP